MTSTSSERGAAALGGGEARFRAIAEGVPVAIVLIATDGLTANPPDILFLNERASELLGPDPATQYRRLQGLWGRPQAPQGLIRRTLETGEVTGLEGILSTEADGSLAVLVSARPIEHEGRSAILAALVDISRQRQAEAELARQREALHQSEKLGALGSLLAGVAHELNNPLSIVTGYATMLRDFATDERTRLRAEKIANAADRCAKIVHTFLAMARSRPPQPGSIQLNQLIAAVLEMLAYGLRTTDITVTRDLAADLPLVTGDADQLHQVLTNLIVNAQQAMQDVPAARGLIITTRHQDDRVEVEVSDTGPGIPPALRARIFEPFFTTKPVGAGTGIGLSVSRGLIMAHGGSLAVDEAPGGGARFRVTLPTALPPAPAALPARPRAASSGLRLLIVDDETDLLAMLVEALSRDGHEVLTALSGREALALIDAHSFDLVLSDVRMPDIDGIALYRALRERRPELVRRLIFMTGDVLGGGLGLPMAELEVPILEKPVELGQLRELLIERARRLGRVAAIGPADPASSTDAVRSAAHRFGPAAASDVASTTGPADAAIPAHARRPPLAPDGGSATGAVGSTGAGGPPVAESAHPAKVPAR